MINTYADALYRIKRGFLIIGLTGYTGSGCTSIANILAKSKPEFPGYEVIENVIDEQRVKKLERIWAELEWHKFITIEISKVIFLLAIYSSIKSNFKKGPQGILRELALPRKEIFLSANHLIKPNINLYKRDAARKIVVAYENAKQLYGIFKKQANLNLEEFIELMQNWGDETRRFGKILAWGTSGKANPENILILPEATRRIIKSYRIARDSSHFVIDAFRDPFEVEFFKRRYNEFYLIGVHRDLTERQNILLSSGLSKQFIKNLNKREKGKLFDRKTKNNVDLWITSQNIDECLQRADYYLVNKNVASPKRPILKFHIIKLLCLINKPGCIPPTIDERNMQLAMSARQNSGCISRHVGAVVVNREGYVLGVGWNDPPKGQIPCLFRSGKDILQSNHQNFYSNFEKSEKFIEHIEKENIGDNPFCFREELSKIEDGKKLAEYTRALHAEENAMLQAARHGFEALKDGILYTTDCTCTLCAKKAYHLGVKRIVYIEEYPGISIQQTIETGEREIKVEQFQGVVGAAFFKLFTPLVQEKDFLKLYS